MRIRGILFDMDGLMFDTERISSLAFDHVEKELGIDLRSGMPDMTGRSVKDIARLYRESTARTTISTASVKSGSRLRGNTSASMDCRSSRVCASWSSTCVCTGTAGPWRPPARGRPRSAIWA